MWVKDRIKKLKKATQTALAAVLLAFGFSAAPPPPELAPTQNTSFSTAASGPTCGDAKAAPFKARAFSELHWSLSCSVSAAPEVELASQAVVDGGGKGKPPVALAAAVTLPWGVLYAPQAVRVHYVLADGLSVLDRRADRGIGSRAPPALV